MFKKVDSALALGSSNSSGNGGSGSGGTSILGGMNIVASNDLNETVYMYITMVLR